MGRLLFRVLLLLAGGLRPEQTVYGQGGGAAVGTK